MKQGKIDKIVTFLIENDTKAQDVWFGWKKIFKSMVDIENSRKGILYHKYGYKYESEDV